MTDDEVEQKFRRLVEPRYGQERAGEMLEVCWDLDKIRLAGNLVRLFA
jgi:hypothetical protein